MQAGPGSRKVDVTRILVSPPKQSPTNAGGEACLVHIYPTGPAMGSRFRLGDVPLVIGRDADCDICIRDESVSRRHASIHPDGDAYRIRDLQSTNGTFVNDVRVTVQKLKDGDYLHIGNCICRYLAGGNVETQYHEEIHRLTIIDALTDVYNRRYFQEYLSHELASSTRYRRCLALAIFDVDFFKQVNDRLGHLGGDYTLRELAGYVKKNVRATDIFARYGGEEFALVMPDTNRGQAVRCVERLRQLVADHPFRFNEHVYPVTVSAGVGAFAGEDWMTTRELISEADAKLLLAKQNGRNRVEG
jgi:diguanylate cyclase (GGDEF)-like protein